MKYYLAYGDTAKHNSTFASSGWALNTEKYCWVIKADEFSGLNDKKLANIKRLPGVYVRLVEINEDDLAEEECFFGDEDIDEDSLV